MLKHPRPPSNSLGMMDYQSADHEQLMKRLRSGPTGDEVIILLIVDNLVDLFFLSIMLIWCIKLFDSPIEAIGFSY